MVKNIKPTDKLVFELSMNPLDRNEEKLNALQAEIAEKYGLPKKNVKVIFNPVTLNKEGKTVSLASDVIENIQDTQFFLALCQDYMLAKGINDIDFEDIKKINEEVEQYVDFSQYSKHKHYRFKYVKWSNYLSYGPDNYFDFTKMHGLVLLNSHPGNQGGKTTFAINLLRFALFGKATKSPNLNSVFNDFLPEATEVMVEACLEIEGTDYVIRRTVTRPALKKRTDKSKPKQTVEYYKVADDGTFDMIENCEGETSQQTNNIIKETVGNPEDFDLVISATKKTLDNLFEKGKTEQGRLFSKWLGLVTIEQKEEIAKDLWKKNISPSLQSNKYNRATLDLEIKDYLTCNTENEDNIKQCEAQKNKINEELLKLNQDKVDILKRRKEIKEELQRLDVATIDNTIDRKNNELQNKRSLFQTRKGEYLALKDVSFDKEKYTEKLNYVEEQTKEKHSLEVQNGEIRANILNIKNEIKRIQELISRGKCPNCGQVINVSKQNDVIEEHESEIKQLTTIGVSNKNKIDKIDTNIQNTKLEIAKLEEDREKENQLQKLIPTLTAIKANIDTLKLEIEKLEGQKCDIEKNRDNIAYNNEIDNRIRIIDATISEKNKEKEQYIRDIETCNGNIKYNNKCIEERKELINTLLKEEKIIRNWSVYQELVGKNGVMKIVLKRALPIINNEIKRILDGICDFNVVLDINEKNEVEISLISDGHSMPIDVSGSGFETTFAAIAVRSALATISSLAVPSCLVLDECDATVNEENLDALYELYHRLLGLYDYIIHITHDTTVEDRHDMVVTVVKEGHISKIES